GASPCPPLTRCRACSRSPSRESNVRGTPLGPSRPGRSPACAIARGGGRTYDLVAARNTNAEDAMRKHKVGTQEEWSAARQELLQREQELGSLDEELAKHRQELPWVPVEKEYTFDTDDGKKTLAELFDGRSQLLIYHLMFGPSYEVACPGCTGLADHFDAALVHLNSRDVTLIAISRAPIEKLQAYKRRMGWQFPYVSSFGSDFNFDFDFTP